MGMEGMMYRDAWDTEENGHHTLDRVMTQKHILKGERHSFSFTLASELTKLIFYIFPNRQEFGKFLSGKTHQPQRMEPRVLTGDWKKRQRWWKWPHLSSYTKALPLTSHMRNFQQELLCPLLKHEKQGEMFSNKPKCTFTTAEGLPGGPVAKTSGSQCRVPRFNSCSGN